MSSLRSVPRRPRPLRLAAGAAAALLVSGVAGCGGDDQPDTPPVCDAVTSLQSSLESVAEIDLTASGAVDELKSSLSAIRGDVADVKEEASSEYSSQVDAAETALGTLTDSVQAATSDPSAATIGAIGTAITPAVDALTTLVDDVTSTC